MRTQYLCDWAEEKNIEDTLTAYRWPMGHHKNVSSTNLLEALQRGDLRRTYVARVFPNKPVSDSSVLYLLAT